MAELNVRLVAADREVWSGEATMVVAKTTEGEIGILPGHEPVLALLVDGVVRIEAVGGEKFAAAVHGGFFSVDQNQVAILAEAAELGSEVDADRARTVLERLSADGTGSEDDEEAERQAAVRRAESRLKAASFTP